MGATGTSSQAPAFHACVALHIAIVHPARSMGRHTLFVGSFASVGTHAWPLGQRPVQGVAVASTSASTQSPASWGSAFFAVATRSFETKPPLPSARAEVM